MELPEVEIERKRDIELEVDTYVSLLYYDGKYHAWKLDTVREEEIEVDIDIDDDADLPFKEITVKDKSDFKILIEMLREKGEVE